MPTRVGVVNLFKKLVIKNVRFIPMVAAGRIYHVLRQMAEHSRFRIPTFGCLLRNSVCDDVAGDDDEFINKTALDVRFQVKIMCSIKDGGEDGRFFIRWDG